MGLQSDCKTLFFTLILMQWWGYSNAQFAATGCFPLHIEKCNNIEFEVSCLYLPGKTPETLQLELYCPRDEIIEVMEVIYSMPSTSATLCSKHDKHLYCNSKNPCYCCTRIEEICSVSTNLDEISESCNNKNNCLITVQRYPFTNSECPSFTWDVLGERGNCDKNPDQCYSRWINVAFKCQEPKDQKNPAAKVTNPTCPKNLGSAPTALPLIGDDNWANFQVHFTFPCDGLIKQVWYHQSVPAVPVYLGIWHRKPGNKLLLKHKIRLQSDSFGSVHKVCEPAVEVEIGDFVGIHHSSRYPHSVIPHEIRNDSQLYQTLLVEVFDKDMAEGEELDLSGRNTKIAYKAFALQLLIGFQMYEYSSSAAPINKDATETKSNPSCPESLGSEPIALPLLGDDNWANFQANFTFPCDGLINQVWYHQSVPAVPVYLGIWHRKPGNKLLLKHKIRLQSDSFGSVYKVCEPAVEVEIGDFVGIHHSFRYPHSVIPHDTPKYSQLYETLVVELFDENMVVGEELELSGRNTKVVDKVFAIQLHLGFDFMEYSTDSINTIAQNTPIGMILGVAVGLIIVLVNALVIAIYIIHKFKQKYFGKKVQESVNEPYHRSTRREVEIQDNNDYLTPLNRPVVLREPSAVLREPSTVYQEIQSSKPVQNKATQVITGEPSLQSNNKEGEMPQKYVAVFYKNLSGAGSIDEP